MQNRIMVLTFLLLGMTRCDKTDIIDKHDLRSLIITVDNEKPHFIQSREIKDGDSLNLIINKLNRGKATPIKFYPTHRLKLIYNNGKEEIIFCNSSSMKYRGITYELQEKIQDIVK
jgi:hypothetical protein